MQRYPPQILIKYTLSRNGDYDYLEISDFRDITGYPVGCALLAQIRPNISNSSTICSVQLSEGEVFADYSDSADNLDTVAAPDYLLELKYYANNRWNTLDFLVLDRYETEYQIWPSSAMPVEVY